MLKLKVLLPALCCIAFSFCKKDTKTQITSTTTNTTVSSGKTSTVAFNFKALVNGSPLKASTWYTNANADSFTVSRYNYYISNIKFTRTDGFVFSEVQSYHLNKHLEGRETFTVSGLPEGTYTNIEFLIGIDSAMNVSGVQGGVLDPGENMFWDWTTGYVFFKLEGTCKTVQTPEVNDFAIHIGGFSAATTNCIQKCIFNLTQALVAKNGSKNGIFYNARIDEVFKNPVVLSFDQYGGISGGRPALDVSNNYRDMFDVEKVQN